jgi:hypothetical protein
MKFSIILLAASVLNAATYYISTTGNGANPGTKAQPWTRASVMPSSLTTNPKNIQAGDTVCLEGGTYDAPVLLVGFVGTANAHITITKCDSDDVVIFDQSEHTVLSGSAPAANMQIQPDSAYVDIIGIIFQDSNTKRSFTTEEYLTCIDDCRPVAVNNLGSHIRFINNVFRNNGGAIADQAAGCATQIIGNKFYYGGWETVASPETAFGMPLYFQNKNPATCTEPKIAHSNAIWAGVNQCIQIFGTSGSYPRNIQLINNVLFNCGITAQNNDTGPIIIGGHGSAQVDTNVITGNIGIQTVYPASLGARFDGFRVTTNGCTNCTVTSNYFYLLPTTKGDVLEAAGTMLGTTIESGNRFIGVASTGSAASFPNSTITATETQDQVLFRINPYDTTKAMLVLVDGDGNGSVTVNLPGCTGAAQLRDMMNYSVTDAEAILTCGVASNVTMAYSGDILPYVGTPYNAPVHTGNTVRVFDVIITSAGPVDTVLSVTRGTTTLGLKYAQSSPNISCTIAIDGDTVATQTEQTSPRYYEVTGLVANTQYLLTLTCNGTQQYNANVTTLASISGTRSVTFSSGRMPLNATSLRIEWGGTTAMSSNTTVSCTNGCSTTVSVPAQGPVWWRYKYQLTGVDVTSPERTRLLP